MKTQIKSMVVIICMIATTFFIVTDSFAASKKSKKNQKNAEAYCAQLKEKGIPCKVAKTIGCGPGWKKAKKFKNGGNAWYACTRSKYGKRSDTNRDECRAWCKEHSELCSYCDDRRGCGRGYKAVRMFGGTGKNWYACDPWWEENKKLCERWCRGNEECTHCSAGRGCGFDHKSMKKFDIVRVDYKARLVGPITENLIEDLADTINGTAWYACRKR